LNSSRLLSTFTTNWVWRGPTSLLLIQSGYPSGKSASHPSYPRNRLYQASFLLRDYSFGLEELPFNADGQLPLQTDPKLVWAQRNLINNPVEVNRAERHQLMRVPGIGTKGAEAILNIRRLCCIRDVTALKKIGIMVTALHHSYCSTDDEQHISLN